MENPSLIDWEEEVEPVVIKIEKNRPDFELEVQRLSAQLAANDIQVTKVEYLTHYEQQINQPEVQQVNGDQDMSVLTADNDFLKQVSREQRRLIAGQRLPVPPEDISRRVVHVTPDVVDTFFTMENGDGIVWTPIPEVRSPISEMEYREDGYQENQRGNEIIDRKSIIENKDNTKEFLMGKMLESIENESYYHGGGGGNDVINDLAIASEIKINFPKTTNDTGPPPLPKSPMPQLPVVVVAQRVEEEVDAMQLFSARPAIVVEFPTKVSDSGVKKTRAQQSAEARIAKEIEEIQVREAELMRTRVISSSAIEAEVEADALPPLHEPISIKFVPDISTQPFVTHPPSPLPPPIIPVPSFPVLETSKVQPLVDAEGEEEPTYYKFYKETAVERDVRLATQREEELRREKQQIQREKTEPETIIKETRVKVVELESQVVETSSSERFQPKQEPQQLAKLVLSGPVPSTLYSRVPELKLTSPSLPIKISEMTNEMEIITVPRSPVTPTTPNTPTSASIHSGKPWTLTNNNNNNSNWNGSLKRGSIERVVVGPLPNRGGTKGLMEKFLANHGRPMPVFVPKTTIPPVYDFTNKKSTGETNGHANRPSNGQVNGHTNGQLNGHEEKFKENVVESEIIVKAEIPKNTIKRLSSVENMILEELRNIQGRELELRKERSTITSKIEENGEVNEAVNNNSGAWGIFTLIGDNNNNNNNNSSVC